MRDPGAVMAVARLAQFVGAHLLHRRLVSRRIVADRDLRRHAAHRVNVAPVAGLDQQQTVAAQKVAVIVTCARSGSIQVGSSANFLM